MRALIAGCGYVGMALARRILQRGGEVVGMRRSPAAAAELEAAGVQPWIGDFTNPEQLGRLPGPFDWVIHCGAPARGEEGGGRSVYVDGVRALIARFEGSPLRAFVFTSSTSVYAQDDGSWVTEDSPATPSTLTGRILREAEDILSAAASRGFPARILRVAGIYGPGRNRVSSALAGDLRIEGEGARRMNMVHRDDVASAIEAALEFGTNGAIYNVSDGNPVPEREFAAWLLTALGRGRPGQASAAQIQARRRMATNKRVSPERLRRELKWQPQFPDFREAYRPWVDEALASSALSPSSDKS
jgi:nucleoside-diphosphate-sugar epimerase